jgi:hypothetical protein
MWNKNEKEVRFILRLSFRIRHDQRQRCALSRKFLQVCDLLNYVKIMMRF